MPEAKGRSRRREEAQQQATYGKSNARMAVPGRPAANKVGEPPGRSRTLLYARLVHEVMSEWDKGGEAGMNWLPEKSMPER